MKRINLIIGKKQIILAGCVLILGVAVYANFAIGNSLDTVDKNNYGDTQFVNNTSSNTTSKVDLTSNPNAAQVNAEGENKAKDENKVQPVSQTVSNNTDNNAYFAQARIDKQKSRDEAVEVIQSMYTGGDLTVDEKEVVAQSAVTVGDLIETETKVETMLKALGFEDALCYISGKSANIIVMTNNLDAAKAAQIKSTLLSEVDIADENITIVEVN